MPRYRVAVMLDGKRTWLEWCEGLYCTDGCGDTFAGIEGIGIVDVAYYRCHWMGANPAWGKWETDDDDGGAGNDRDQVDMIELTICPC